ncbi:hypothetical protein [Zoogloea sp.]|uniref:hypothetical protein n=1 Tax=Zoogloea sp. TaxID=49181 RepID=UPI002615530F|nr:hypothetical protein [Zoogloea sp.]MDD3354384.1 hypothetical protein [Zoogloea sp.]
MVTTDPAAQSGRPQSAEALGKFIAHLPAVRSPNPAARKASPVDLPILPGWAGWR